MGSPFEAAAVTVDRGSVLLDTVKRGSFQREIRGVGTLVPVKILVVAANVEGRVVNRYVLPGAPMEPGTVMFDLANPKLAQDLFEAESQLKGAEADLANLKAQCDGLLFQQQSQLHRCGRTMSRPWCRIKPISNFRTRD